MAQFSVKILPISGSLLGENQQLDLFRSYQSDDDARQVMRVAASGGPLFSKLRRLELEEEQGFLVPKERIVNTYNNTINVQNSGVMGQTSVSASGDAFSSGEATAQVGTNVAELIQEIRHLITESGAKTILLEEVESELAEAEADPSPSRLQRLVALLERYRKGLEEVEGIAQTTTALAGRIALLAIAAGVGP